VLGFSRHSFSVSEADSVARVHVRRLGGAAGEISFEWYTEDDSARAGQDYVFGFGEERMAPGQTQRHSWYRSLRTRFQRIRSFCRCSSGIPAGPAWVPLVACPSSSSTMTRRYAADTLVQSIQLRGSAVMHTR
jgi:hypothetical protein